LTYFKTSFAAS